MALASLRVGESCLSRLHVTCSYVCVKRTRRAHKYTQVSVKPNRYTVVYRDLHGAIEEDSMAKDFVYALDPNERQLLHVELDKFMALSKSNDTDTARPPTTSQLKAVALHNALPFIGFGFLDNCLMIIAGEYIEVRFGAALGISTMAAAALGNWVSDLAGVQTAHYVEVVASKLGVRAPALTPKQVDMSRTRWASSIGKIIGVSIGCIIGMFPLLFYTGTNKTSEETTNEKEDKTNSPSK